MHVLGHCYVSLVTTWNPIRRCTHKRFITRRRALKLISSDVMSNRFGWGCSPCLKLLHHVTSIHYPPTLKHFPWWKRCHFPSQPSFLRSDIIYLPIQVNDNALYAAKGRQTATMQTAISQRVSASKGCRVLWKNYRSKRKIYMRIVRLRNANVCFWNC